MKLVYFLFTQKQNNQIYELGIKKNNKVLVIISHLQKPRNQVFLYFLNNKWSVVLSEFICVTAGDVSLIYIGWKFV